MNDFLKMDIFFVVTTIVTVIVGVLLIFVLIRILRILKNIEEISALVEEEGQKLRDDIAHVRENVREEGIRLKHLMSFLGLASKLRRRAKKKTS